MQHTPRIASVFRPPCEITPSSNNPAFRGAALTQLAPPWLRWSKLLLSAWLIALIAVTLVVTRHWPLVNDGALQHYISFLTDAGFAPYRQIADMNLPGSLLIDWTVVHSLGGGPIAWRVFDALLLLTAAAAMLLIAHPRSWFAGVAAASLLWLLHARDGMGQTAQRDLMEATLLLLVTAAAFHAVRSGTRWPFALAALCAGIAVTIKPDSLLLAATILIVALARSRRLHPGRSRASLALTLGGFLVPLVAALVFLLHHRALNPFLHSVTEITPLYARLGRQRFAELLRDCLSTPMRVLLALAVPLAIARHRSRTRATSDTPDTPDTSDTSDTWERSLLLLGVVWALASFFLQGKGYLYHRYPALAFLLLWAAIEYTEALNTPGWPRAVGAAGLLYASLVVAPLSAVRAARATWTNPLLSSLEADLTPLGGPSLAGSIQCVDSISGCNTVLLRMRLPETTGMLSDFLLFGPPGSPAVRRARSTFWSEINAQPPRLIIVTGWLHPTGPDHFRKLALWPDFARFLEARYTLIEQRTFPPGSNGPSAYRIYERR